MKYLYRIVNILLAILMFPVVILSDLVAFRMSTSFIDEVGLEESFSIKFIIDVFTGKEEFWHTMLIENSEGTAMTWPEGLDPIKGRLITFVVCFALVLVAMLFIIVWSCCSNKRIPVVVASVFSLISTIVMIACFNSAATLIVDGTVNLIGALSSSVLGNLVSMFVGVDGLRLGGFHNGMIFVIIGLLVWTGAYYLIELGDTPEEKAAAQAKRKK